MGMPVFSVESFERHIKHTYRQKIALVIMANPNSDSRVVDLIHRNFHIMDTVSDDVFFFLPGYYSDGYRIELNNNMSEEHWFREFEEREFSDSHAANIHTKCINSPRLGNISFNDISFADFVMEFTKKIPGYFYVEMCQMILIPISSYNNLLYKNAKVYDLDRIAREPGGPSFDSFIFQVFNLLRDNGNRNSRTPLLDRLLGKKKNIFHAVDLLYNEATTTKYHEDRYEIVIQEVVCDMEKLLTWSLREDFYFISYSSKNIMMAEMLKKRLQDKGLKVWMAPDGIPQGRSYSQAVPAALMFARHFVLILTQEAANSRWVMRELDLAINNEDNMNVKILLTNSYTTFNIHENKQLYFYLNTVQIKYNYDDVIYDDDKFNKFVT